MSLTISRASKYDDEILDQVVEFADAMPGGGVTIASRSSEVATTAFVTTTDLVVASLGGSGTQATFRVSAGIRGTSYVVDIYATLSNGEKIGHRILYEVK